MNLSIKNNVIWLCPERTGGRILREIFKNYDFFVCDKINNFELKPLSENQPSRGSIIPEEYKNFQIISSIRNPYDRIWSHYEFFNKKNLRPKEFVESKRKFNEWVNKSLKFTLKGIETDPFYEGEDVFNKWKFDSFKPDYVIKLENLQNDVMGVDFIKKQPNLFDKNIFINERFSNERYFQFDYMYEVESAKKIFNFYKNHFFGFGYDPFSYTKDNLSNEEKINFLHTYNLG